MLLFQRQIKYKYEILRLSTDKIYILVLLWLSYWFVANYLAKVRQAKKQFQNQNLLILQLFKTFFFYFQIFSLQFCPNQKE